MLRFNTIRGARSLLCRSLGCAGGTFASPALPTTSPSAAAVFAGETNLGSLMPGRAPEPLRETTWIGHRCFSDQADCCNPTGMPEEEYNRIADNCIDELGEKIEEFLEDAYVGPFDVECSMGVLTVNLADKGTFVINKQTPNRQIWLSSPVSGPFRYDPVDGKWLYSRDSHSLHGKLQEEIGSLVGKTLEL